MKYIVNENCIGCGMCAGVCPTVFELTEDGTARAKENEVAQADRADAEYAMNSCPVGAIEKE